MPTLERTSRNAGVDLARAVALVGIMAVHIFPPLQADGSAHPAFVIDSGRSPALFPLLAGVGLALAHGGRRPPRGRDLWRDRAGVVARALLLVALGLLLGRVDSPPLVILLHFGAMFLGATVFLGLRARTLWWLALGWAVLAPTASHLLRTGPAGPAGSPALPGPLGVLQPVVDLLLTSAYPVAVWMAYVLLGLAVGRTGLPGPRGALTMLLAGTAVAVLTTLGAGALLAAAGGPERLAAHTEGLTVYAPNMPTQLQVGLVGTTPTTDPAWLLVTAPHSGTTPDLLHTGGAAVAVLGACLLLVERLGRKRLASAVALGSMTLTLYSAHVVALWRDGPLVLGTPFQLYVGHVGVALVVAMLWRSLVGRGPFEALAARLEGAARKAVPAGPGKQASRVPPGHSTADAARPGDS